VGFDFFSQPKPVVPMATTTTTTKPPETTKPIIEFTLHQRQKEITARGYLSDDGFVVMAGSDATLTANESFTGSYADLRKKLINQGVIVPKANDPTKMTFAIDYAFSAPSPAGAVIVGNNISGTKNWKTNTGQTLGDFLEMMTNAFGDPKK